MTRAANGTRSASSFATGGFTAAIEEHVAEITDLYLADGIPWVVGYSGGKDSTAVLQLVWTALAGLPPEQRRKPVYVISTDTLVENPIVALWVSKSLETMAESAQEQGLPLIPKRLTPTTENTFWVNLIGRGYPAPRPKFRWCTERLKINPSTGFITSVVQSHGEAILLLGTRKAESIARARLMGRYEQSRERKRLSPNGNLANSHIYTPIEDWSNDDVWMYLMQVPNPWGYDNKDLLTMYQGASADGECPLVVDTSTPSCGDSRFGCWVCTLVNQDRSMQAMIQNDDEKQWMLPLLELRNRLDPPKTLEGDRPLRDFRRMNGTVQLFHDRPIHGPYTQQARESWLRQVLEAQCHIRLHGPESVRGIDLVTLAELEVIRRIWVVEKHELEDSLPEIYKQVTGERYPGRRLDDNMQFATEEIKLLRELCGDDPLHFQLVRELLSTERRHRNMLRRAGLYEAFERAFVRNFYTSEDDAVRRARQRRDSLALAQEAVLGPEPAAGRSVVEANSEISK